MSGISAKSETVGNESVFRRPDFNNVPGVESSQEFCGTTRVRVAKQFKGGNKQFNSKQLNDSHMSRASMKLKRKYVVVDAALLLLFGNLCGLYRSSGKSARLCHQPDISNMVNHPASPRYQKLFVPLPKEYFQIMRKLNTGNQMW